jgi:diadenylate cyclase
MSQFLGSILDQVRLTTIVDIGLTALLIYWLFSLIRGTRAVRLVIGVSVLVVVYALAVAFDLRLLTQILQGGAVVGLFALVVIFQPELRRALERIGRVGSFRWLLSPADTRAAAHVANEVARAAAGLSADGHGALIVLERETGLEEVAETGVMIHGDVSADLLRTIFMPRAALHDGAVIIRDDRIVAAGALLPLAETSIHTERFGTRHRAALGITEQTDAVVVVVSEENGQISLVERARIVRNLTEASLARAIQGLLDPAGGRRTAFAWRADRPTGTAGRSPRMGDLGRFMGRPANRERPTPPSAASPVNPTATATPTPAAPPTTGTASPSAPAGSTEPVDGPTERIGTNGATESSGPANGLAAGDGPDGGVSRADEGETVVAGGRAAR